MKGNERIEGRRGDEMALEAEVGSSRGGSTNGCLGHEDVWVTTSEKAAMDYADFATNIYDIILLIIRSLIK
ncbi:hypothetical protein P0O24_01635 [Methanotrichaceae archaeon M04Ac]|uniref:Uncharacterized protein n=1 Tax=Candidatus Methanocrinis alkalitolerans TaxID=3033395 RepID=A0ABT5XC92_9EURY|nr:hypothetical protein [Candidatus Methanocrinis alkalitolerans]MCR3884289.1 hypothetical protein [Methanothrix sp.]MDF0592285.1 hypothetical protein [Candidatus Methanocrinis alkalitolerans]